MMRVNCFVQVQQRLGHWHVWSTLGRPNGLHMYLDIKEPEQVCVSVSVGGWVRVCMCMCGAPSVGQTACTCT